MYVSLINERSIQKLMMFMYTGLVDLAWTSEAKQGQVTFCSFSFVIFLWFDLLIERIIFLFWVCEDFARTC